MSVARWIAIAVLVVLSPFARAQYGPAGNEHPESAALTAGATGAPGADDIRFPFGVPTAAVVSDEDKLAFARQLDLSPLRDLAVQHNRVKILDTLARESVRSLTGKPRHTLFVRTGDVIEKHKPDALFTLFDALIDPAFYEQRPLIVVDFLPLRRAILELEYEGDPARAERELKAGAVSPGAIERRVPGLLIRHESSPAWKQAINDTENRLKLHRFGAANLLLIAPASTDDTWHHISEAPADVTSIARELGDAWRALDAERTNAAIVRLAEALPALNADLYPTSRRSMELAYNRSNAFEWGSWAYLVSFLLLILAFGTGRRWLKGAGLITFLIAFSLHAVGFTLRCIIAERFAIQNQYESMGGLSLFAAAVGLGLMIVKRQWLFGAAAAGAGFLVLITATQTGIPGVTIEREAAILNTSVLLKYHVTTVLTSYGLITLGMIVSVFYLATHYGNKLLGKSEAQLVAEGALSTPGALQAAGLESRGPQDSSPAALNHTRATPSAARTLKDLDTAQMTILQLAFWTLGVGTLLGAWWADHSWGRWWAFDPKETWALVTWIVYLIVIHVRLAGLRDKGLTTAWLSVVGFIVMLWTYFGVNLLLPGLHAYA